MDESEARPRWRTITEEELQEIEHAETQRREREQINTIQLDCPPGYPRPGDLIDGVRHE